MDQAHNDKTFIVHMERFFFWITLCIVDLFSTCCPVPQWQVVISLNGEWQMAKTGGELPEIFPATAPVPGLGDLATPALDISGTLYRNSSWYWHRHTFDLPDTQIRI
jgi:hypothetical protein